MSHLPERKEKNCLNCGAEVQGRFCHICGQENIEPKESFWHLVTHFVYDVTHFDGKFFSTLKYLLFKPGFLSHEYLRGRRAVYLHPIRMYVFTSAFFFLIFFSFNKEEEAVKMNETNTSAAAILKKLEKKKKSLAAELKDSLPSIARMPIQKAIQMVDSDMALIKRDTAAKDRLQTNVNNFNVFSFSDKNANYRSLAQYDSIQKTLPGGSRDNFIQEKFVRQSLHLKEKYGNNGKEMLNAISTKFKHLFPQMMFTSLPLFALLLQLLYARRNKFFYVNHVVYTIHLYCAIFIIILAGIFTDYLLALLSANAAEWGSGLFTLAGFFYFYKSLRNFYEQRRGKTILKYFLALFLSLFLMVFIFTIFFLFSAMAI